MQSLRRDSRGYPVPWFVAWRDDNTPEFRAMDGDKFIAAIKWKLCWVCGERLGVNMTFVAGPMCGINRTSSEPPGHYECATWSAVNCPFLNNPHMVRREDEEFSNQHLRDNSAGIAIARNPGVTMLWNTRSYEVFDDGKGGYLITMGNPESVEWYCRGRKATRLEVEESIDSGLPSLLAMAKLQEGAEAELRRFVERFRKYIPA